MASVAEHVRLTDDAGLSTSASISTSFALAPLHVGSSIPTVVPTKKIAKFDD